MTFSSSLLFIYKRQSEMYIKKGFSRCSFGTLAHTEQNNWEKAPKAKTSWSWFVLDDCLKCTVRNWRSLYFRKQSKWRKWGGNYRQRYKESGIKYISGHFVSSQKGEHTVLKISKYLPGRKKHTRMSKTSAAHENILCFFRTWRGWLLLTAGTKHAHKTRG